VGKCDRLDKCGYHFTPREHFAAGGERPNGEWTAPPPKPEPPGYRMTREDVQATMGHAEVNALLGFLRSRLDPEAVDRVAHEYAVGTWTQPGNLYGAAVFWQVDHAGEVRTGKVIGYGPDGHRLKGRTNWTHALAGGVAEGYRLDQCLFGEHLLHRYPDAPVGIVEAEKTALVARLVVPDILWIATGSLDGLTRAKALPLVDRHVTLWPDLGKGHEEWSAKAPDLEPLFASLTVADLLEHMATPEQCEDGLDLADFLLPDHPATAPPPTIGHAERTARALVEEHNLWPLVHALELDLSAAAITPLTK